MTDSLSLRFKFDFSYFSKPFHKFLLVIFLIFSFYTYHRICENFDNVRLFFNNTEQSKFVSLQEPQKGQINLVTKSPKRISFIIKSNTIEELKPEDFNVSFDEISDEIKQKVVFFENENYLVLDLPKFGVNIKNKVLHYNIQCDAASIKFTNDNVIINKQSGNKNLYKLIVALVYFPFLIFFFCLLLHSDKWKIENKFLIITITFGLVLIFGRPPCSIGDELKHFDSAYNMSNMIMGLGNSYNTHTLLKRQCDTNILPDYYPDNYYKIDYYSAWYGKPKDYFMHLKNNIFNQTDTTLVQTPQDKVLLPQRAYIFSALMITFMRLIGVNQFVLYYSGVITNLLIAAFLIFFSLKKNQKLRNNVIVILCSFPILLAQLCSYTYDALLLSSAFALINYSIYFYYSKERKVSDLLILIGLCIFVFPIKVVYFLLSFYFLFTYLLNKFKQLKLYHIVIVLLFFYLILYIFVSNTNFSIYNYRTLAEGTLDITGYSISQIILHPVNAIKILFNSIIEQTFNKFVYMFVISNFWAPQIKLFEYVFLFLFIAMFFLEKDNIKEFYLSSFVIFILVSIFIFVVGMTWTNVESPLVWGVQLKYFFPVLPLLFISSEAIRTEKIVFKFNDLYDLSIMLSFFSIVHTVLEIYTRNIHP